MLAGNDLIDGGEGIDTVSFSQASASVHVDLSQTTAQTIGLTEGDDTISNVENIIGSNNADTLKGDSNTNLIEAKNGDDTLLYSGGNDTLDGGDGKDTADFSALLVVFHHCKLFCHIESDVVLF